MRRPTLVALLVALAWPGAARAQDVALLLVQSSRQETDVALQGGRTGAARVQISVPAGFTLDLARPVGTLLGRATVQLSSAADLTGPAASAEGDVVVDDAASFTGNPRFRACAPGAHAAVWRLEPLDVPVFVDPASGPDAALGGYDLRVCLDLRHGLSFQGLELDLERVVAPPANPGIYVWSAFVTPPTAAGAPDDGATYEARCLVPRPTVLSLHARRLKGKPKGRYVLSGRLTLAGKPRAHATIQLLRVSLDEGGGDSVTFTLGAAKATETNATGRFRLRVRVERRTFFLVYWFGTPRERCSAPSGAPGGCVSETTSPAISEPVATRP
jgi:hypothetical protein